MRAPVEPTRETTGGHDAGDAPPAGWRSPNVVDWCDLGSLAGVKAESASLEAGSLGSLEDAVERAATSLGYTLVRQGNPKPGVDAQDGRSGNDLLFERAVRLDRLATRPLLTRFYAPYVGVIAVLGALSATDYLYVHTLLLYLPDFLGGGLAVLLLIRSPPMRYNSEILELRLKSVGPGGANPPAPPATQGRFDARAVSAYVASENWQIVGVRGTPSAVGRKVLGGQPTDDGRTLLREAVRPR
jgi:hypothetical protein